jgi:trimethylamine---corrinoid protein Co-methyltransferase
MREDHIATIRLRSMEVLEHVGILIEHEQALGALADAGADVDRKSRLAKIPQWLIEKTLATAPREFTLTGEDASRDLAISDQSPPRGRPVISLDWILDHGTRQRRAVTSKDLESWIRVADALPNLALVSGVYPWDVPLESRDVRVAATLLSHSGKPVLIAPYSGWSVRQIAELLAVIPDRRRSRVVVFSSCNSPLIYSEGQMDALVAAAECGFPVMVNSSAVTGATAPVTLAGTLVVMNAEILAGIVVAQLIRPGAEVIYAGHPILLDMRTSIASCGQAEAGLLAAALVELGRSYRIPTASNGLTTDSHACDEQAAVEKMLTGYQAVMSGAALNGGAGSLGSLSTASLEQLVIDDDIYDRLLRVYRGFEVDSETLAWNAIAEAGPSGHYLEHPHTLEHLRRELRYSRLAGHVNPEAWMKRGAPDALDVAAARVKAILASKPEPRFEPKVLAELDHVATVAEREKSESSGGRA